MHVNFTEIQAADPACPEAIETIFVGNGEGSHHDHMWEVEEGESYSLEVADKETSYDWIFNAGNEQVCTGQLCYLIIFELVLSLIKVLLQIHAPKQCEWTVKMQWRLECSQPSANTCTDNLAKCTTCESCCKSYLDQQSCDACVVAEC